MSKKNSIVILKNQFKDSKEIANIYLRFKKKLNLFRRKFFLVAVSGGSDSLALTALSKSYSLNNKCKIFYVLIDHNIRKNSSKEALSVKRLLKNFKINLIIIKNKKKIKKNFQAEAREIRYKLLAEFCKKRKIPTIITAHNLEDQVETFFIRLSRGSGLQGLSSMKQLNKINKINLLRPLLNTKRENLKKISKICFGKFYSDPTNKNDKYLRTRIRNLKKVLEKSGINYDQIFRSINNLATSRDTLDVYFKKLYKDLSQNKKNRISIDFEKFKDINNEMKMEVFKKSIKDIAGAYYPPRSKKISHLIEKIQSSKRAKLTLGGCIIFRENNHIILVKEKKN